MNKALVTGAAGFVGFHWCDKMIHSGVTNTAFWMGLDEGYETAGDASRVLTKGCSRL